MTTPAIAPIKTLTFARTINAPITQVYQSFTNRDDICDWLCFDADIRTEVGGYIFLMWYEGPHVYGTFTTVEENKKLAFTWHDGHTDHAFTEVDVTFQEEDGSTTVELIHSGFQDETHATEQEAIWNTRLDNLQSILESGANRTITDRVIIGIIPAPHDEQAAQRLGTPVTTGTRINQLVDGYSAQLAGLQVDDVIVAVAGTTIDENTDMRIINEGRAPGDTVEVEFYRGSEKKSITLELRGYPVPEIPPTFAAMAETFAQEHAETDKALAEALQDATNEAAEFKPAPDVWSVKELLAHLILSSRHELDWLGSYLQGPRRTSPYTEVPGRLAAIISVNPAIDDLMAVLRRTRDEIVAILRQFPPELEARKSNLWWIRFETHLHAARDQRIVDLIKSALDAAANA